MQTIDNTQDLGLLCQRLAKHPYITVDLEFIREKTYFPLLCLIQVASEEETAIIDPLAEGIDLQSFFALMQNRDVTKVFHSCRQDVEIIFELSGIIPQPLFDTQVAACAAFCWALACFSAHSPLAMFSFWVVTLLLKACCFSAS